MTIGLNSKDALFTTGLLRRQPDKAPLQLGPECVGRITRMGKNVTELASGEDITTVLNGGFVQYTRVGSDCVVRKPTHCHIKQAAVLPVAYLTAYYVLVACANLQPGERVLIYSTAGGVDLTTLHIARRCGAQTFTTADSEQEHDYLLSLGVHVVAGSHDEQFAVTLLIASDEQGMDVVLDSLTGRLLGAGLTLLAPLDRFPELGSKDIVEDKALPMRLFTQGGAFTPTNSHAAHGAFGRYLQQIVVWVDDNMPPLLPCKPVPLPEVARAFTTLTTPQRIGKVMITHHTAASMDRLNAMIAERHLGGYTLSMSNAEAMRQLWSILSTCSPRVQLLPSPRVIDRSARGDQADCGVSSAANDTTTQQAVKKRLYPETGVSYSSATREVECVLCRTLEECLDLDRIGINDNHAELEATSLGIVQLSGQMACHYPQVSMASLYNRATVRQLATFCQPPEGESNAPSPQPVIQTNARTSQIAKRVLQTVENTVHSHTSLC